MNIKQIIQEEIDSFEWAKDIQPLTLPLEPKIGVKFTHEGDNTTYLFNSQFIYTITDIKDGFIKLEWKNHDGSFVHRWINVNTYKHLFANGSLLPVW